MKVHRDLLAKRGWPIIRQRSTARLYSTRQNRHALGVTAMAVNEVHDDPMEAVYREVGEKWMHALWSSPQRGGRPTDPVAPYQPAPWRWSEISTYIRRARELVQPGPDAQRRVLTLDNP